MRGLIAGMVSGGVVAALGLGAVSMVTPLPETPGAHLAAVLSATRAPQLVPPAEAPAPQVLAQAEPDPAPEPVPQPAPEAVPAPEPAMPEASPAPQPVPVEEPAPALVAEAPEPAAPEAPAPEPREVAQLPEAEPPVAAPPAELPLVIEPEVVPEPAMPEQETQAEVVPEPAPTPEPQDEPAAEAATQPEPAPEKPRIFAAGENRMTLGQKSAGFGQPAGAMPQGAEPGAKPAVISGRLPQIGGKGADGGKRLEAPGAGAGATPLAQNAMPFVAPEGALLYSVVLIDPGVAAGGLDRATITALGFPMTIAIDPTRPDAPEAARAFRDAGLEVAILAADIPDSATVTDLEVIVEAWRQAVPGAIGVVDGPAAQFRQDRALVQPMVEILARDGLAVIAMEEGLNPAEHLAQAQKAGYVGLWREIDAERERGAVVERMLSRAAFEAQRSGAVAVVLSAWPETVAGLQSWEPVASRSVTLAPVSALALRSLAP